MTPEELPEDPRQWPDDPHALLGVPPGAAEDDIRRAYTRLIRRFKPERFPEQFRRIRDAFEACQQQRFWFAPVPTATQHEPPVATPPQRDECDEHWAAAVAGRSDEAYRQLADAARIQPERTDLPLRLYWLLALNPTLDAERTRHHWLADALLRHRLEGPPGELYRRELQSDPDIVRRDEYAEVLNTAAAPPNLLFVARWRLQAAGRSENWAPIVADFARLRTILPHADEPAWLGYIVALLDWTSWKRIAPLDSMGRDELARLRHLELSHAHAFDRFDETSRVVAGWQTALAEFLPDDLLMLLPNAWADYSIVPGDALGRATATIADAPQANLNRFDRFTEDYGLALVIALTRVLEQARWQIQRGDEAEMSPDLIRGLVSVLLKRQNSADYAWLRGSFLDFAVEESLDPVLIAEACETSPLLPARILAEHLRRDWVLRMTWLAAHLARGYE